MTNWTYMVPAAAVLLMFLLYKEWKRSKRARLYARLFVSILAVSSLLLMAYPYSTKSATENKIILLTGGFVQDSVTQFLQKTGNSLPVFTDVAGAGSVAGKPAQLVGGWEAFSKDHISDTLHVFGNGLDAAALALLHPKPIVFHANPAAPGISHIYWKQTLQTGDELLVQGRYENTTGKPVKISLQAFGSSRDSVIVNAFSNNDFTLHTVPLHMGDAVYALVASSGKDTLQHEPVPVAVQKKAPLQLLLLSSAPDFDNTFLKNNLALQGYQFTLATSISKDKTSRSFLNTPLQQSVRLTAAYLNKFDVLLTDAATLQHLDAAELNVVRTAVRENGTGLLIKMDTQQTGRSFYAPYFPVKNKQSDHLSVLQLREGTADSSRYTLKINNPASIAYVAGTQIILQDNQSIVYASGVVYGSGKIIATTLQNSFSIALAGSKLAYQQLWSGLLTKAAKKIDPGTSWQTKSFLPHVNDAVQWQAEQNETVFSQAVINNTKLNLLQDSGLPFQWQAVYWPPAAGWQPTPAFDTAYGQWYAYKQNDWQQLRDYSLKTATKKYEALHPLLHSGKLFEAAGNVNMPLLMLIIFLSCCIFLWVEQKT